MKVVLLQDSNDLRDRVHFWLENTLKAKIITTTTAADTVIEIRDKGEKVDFVIFDLQRNTLKEYRSFREEMGKALPIILCLEGIVSDISDIKGVTQTQIVNRRNMVEGIAEAIFAFRAAGILGEDGTEEGSTGAFCRIRTPLLLSVVPLKGDIYIRLSEEKHVKLFRQGDQFELSDYQKYTEKKGVEFLYLKRDAVEEFVQKYTSEIRKMLSNVDDLKIIGQSEVSVHEIVHELSKNVGFSPAIENLVHAQMNATLKAIKKTPALRDILSKLESLKGDYLHLHSVLTGHIACGIATEVSWAKGGTYEKLTMAGFLHDVGLRDPKLAKIATIQEFDRELRGAEAKKDFLDHPSVAAELVNKFHEVPPDVDKIIVQHHERPDQTGFPHKLGATRLAPLTCLFIVAHEIADFQIKNMGKPFRIRDFLIQSSGKFHSSVFRKIMDAVEECFE